MYFIFDCNGDIVGNFKGYRTHKGAETQCNLDGKTKVMQTLWARFHAQAQIDNRETRIYSIRWVDQPKSEARIAFEGMFSQSLQALEALTIR